jgi:hypothetical protein
MKRWSGVRWLLAGTLFVGQAAVSQLREIDPAKLPKDSATQSTYTYLAAYERYGQAWTNKWTYDVPKAEVVGAFTSSLSELTQAAKTSPDNHELQLLAALVAHFAYNVDVEAAYDPAMQFLHQAALSDRADYRTNWFLGMQECQANQGAKGMPLLLAIEDSTAWQKLPTNFWDDYVTCATVTRMPAHSLRAISRAAQMGATAQSFQIMKGMNEKSFKPSDLESGYSKQQVWTAEGVNGDVVFTSRLCGVSFAAHGNWGSDVRGVTKGTCVALFEPPAYAAKVGRSSPSVMLMSQPAEPDETLNDFVHKFLKGKYAPAIPTADLYCPSATCVAYEISNKAMYAEEGGAHLLMVAFERDMPEFDGLIFERPESPPKPATDGKMAYFTAKDEYHRLPGKLYYLVLLDSNVAIFDAAKQDYDFFLKSIHVE